MSSATPSNSLGLDFDDSRNQESSTCSGSPENRTANQQIETSKDVDVPDLTTSPALEPSDSQVQSQKEKFDSGLDAKEKKKPYINPERVKTGGAQRVSCAFDLTSCDDQLLPRIK